MSVPLAEQLHKFLNGSRDSTSINNALRQPKSDFVVRSFLKDIANTSYRIVLNIIQATTAAPTVSVITWEPQLEAPTFAASSASYEIIRNAAGDYVFQYANSGGSQPLDLVSAGFKWLKDLNGQGIFKATGGGYVSTAGKLVTVHAALSYPGGSISLKFYDSTTGTLVDALTGAGGQEVTLEFAKGTYFAL